MSGFEYVKFVTVLEVNPRPIVTLDDEKLKVEYGNDFATMCVGLLLLDNAIKGLEAAGAKDQKKKIKLIWRKIKLNWHSRKLGIKNFNSNSLLGEVYKRREELKK